MTKFYEVSIIVNGSTTSTEVELEERAAENNKAYLQALVDSGVIGSFSFEEAKKRAVYLWAYTDKNSIAPWQQSTQYYADEKELRLFLGLGKNCRVVRLDHTVVELPYHD